MRQMPPLSRRRLLRSFATGAAALVRPPVASAQPDRILTKPIPSSGEALPVVGLGSWITFNVGDDIVARDACMQVMSAFFAAILAACWMWVAWAYLVRRYDTINWAASYFAGGFAVEVVLLIWTGLVRNRLRLRPAADLPRHHRARHLSPGPFGVAADRPARRTAMGAGRDLGIAPDPTVVATLGVLVAADRTRWELLTIPLLWCAISGATLWTMQSPDALLMPTVALLALLVVGWKTIARRRVRSRDHRAVDGADG